MIEKEIKPILIIPIKVIGLSIILELASLIMIRRNKTNKPKNFSVLILCFFKKGKKYMGNENNNQQNKKPNVLDKYSELSMRIKSKYDNIGTIIIKNKNPYKKALYFFKYVTTL